VELDLARFLALIRRELGAAEVRILEVEDAAVAAEDGREIRAALPDGRAVAARFPTAPEDPSAKVRHLEELAGTFDAVVHEAALSRRSRPPVAFSLKDELQALCERAAAMNAFVIDANSPVVWGAARPEGLMGDAPLDSVPAAPLAAKDSAGAPAEAGGSPDADSRTRTASRLALRSVRRLIATSALRKGKRMRHVTRSGDSPLLAHSFAGIYLAVVVFEGAFDELRAERAILDSLPRIERLVLALPPLDPSPDTGAGVISIRRSRRR
jgi:hypothetical protein